MKTIIVPSDLSAASINTAYYAADMAVAMKMNILLQHTVAIPMAFSAVPLPAEDFDIMVADAKAEIENFKNTLIKYTHNQIDISIDVTVGRVIDELEHAASQTDIFAVIMGMQGAGGMERTILGSTALSAMRYLKYPVIIVPQDRHFKGIKKIGLAFDIQDIIGKSSIQNIEDLIKQLSCTLDILYVSQDNEEMDAERNSGTKFLLSSLESINPKFHFITNENIEACVIGFVAKENIDLLLVIPQEHGFLGNVFHKSVTKEIALHCPAPIMTLHND